MAGGCGAGGPPLRRCVRAAALCQAWQASRSVLRGHRAKQLCVAAAQTANLCEPVHHTHHASSHHPMTRLWDTFNGHEMWGPEKAAQVLPEGSVGPLHMPSGHVLPCALQLLCERCPALR